MKFLMHKLVPILSALAGVAWLVPVVKQLIQGEWPNAVYITSAATCFLFAVIFFAIGRKAHADSGPPSA